MIDPKLLNSSVLFSSDFWYHLDVFMVARLWLGLQTSIKYTLYVYYRQSKIKFAFL